MPERRGRLSHTCHCWNSANIQVEAAMNWRNSIDPHFHSISTCRCAFNPKKKKKGCPMQNQGQFKVKGWDDGRYVEFYRLQRLLLGVKHFFFLHGWMEGRKRQDKDSHGRAHVLFSLCYREGVRAKQEESRIWNTWEGKKHELYGYTSHTHTYIYLIHLTSDLTCDLFYFILFLF